MQKPNNYENIQGFTDFVRLPAGSYICKVIGVEEGTAKSGRHVLRIALDIADGEYADIYRKAFDANSDQDKRWPCVVTQVTADNNGDASRGLKTFITAIERSNNTTVVWGDKFRAWCKGKKIGGIFREEEYMKRDGTVGVSVKCTMFRSTDSIDPDFIPDRKPLSGGHTGSQVPPFTPLASEDDVPF